VHGAVTTTYLLQFVLLREGHVDDQFEHHLYVVLQHIIPVGRSKDKWVESVFAPTGELPLVLRGLLVIDNINLGGIGYELIEIAVVEPDPDRSFDDLFAVEFVVLLG